MTKQYLYRKIPYKIKVELNTRVEKRPNGDRWHTVFLEIDSKMISRDEVKDNFLLSAINALEGKAKDFIDKKLDSEKPNDKRLAELGFTND